MTPGDIIYSCIYILLITAFIHFSNLSFISHTNSLFPIQILLLGWVHLLWSIIDLTFGLDVLLKAVITLPIVRFTDTVRQRLLQFCF